MSGNCQAITVLVHPNRVNHRTFTFQKMCGWILLGTIFARFVRPAARGFQRFGHADKLYKKLSELSAVLPQAFNWKFCGGWSSGLKGKRFVIWGNVGNELIFVHGCFWHQHTDPACKDGRAPKSNLGYWSAKLARNVTRDVRHLAELKALGWKVLVIWECEALKGGPRLASRLRRFLG